MLRSFRIKSGKTLLVIGAVFGLAGTIDLLAPIDFVTKTVSSNITSKSASGDIVVVATDGPANEKSASWPWPQDQIADTLQFMLEAGAEKVVVSEAIALPDGELDPKLAQVISENPDSIFIVEPTESFDRRTRTGLDFASSVVPVHADKFIRYWRGVEENSYKHELEGRVLTSAASVVSGVDGELGEVYPIDYSINAETIPLVSLAVLVENAATLEMVQNKVVILGSEGSSNRLGLRFLGQNGVFGPATLIAMEAETLKQGRPIVLGWYHGWLVGFACVFLILQVTSERLKFAIMLFSLLGIFAVVTALSTLGLHVSRTAPVYLMIAVATFVSISRGLRDRARTENAVNPISGLPSVNSLRRLPLRDKVLIHAKIRHATELLEILSDENKKQLARKIANLVNPGGDVWHGDNGRFFWFIDAPSAQSVEENFEGLSRIFRNGFSIDELNISLDIVFGVDDRFDVSVSDRVEGATLSAKKAIIKGVQWETYETTDRSAATWSVTMLRELDLAIEKGHINVALQPKLNLRTGQISGAEALARWTHPSRGLIQPDQFIDQAERGDRLLGLTMCVLQKALGACAEDFARDSEFVLSINIAPSMLEDGLLVDLLSAKLAEFGVPEANIMLEVTESSRFADDAACAKTMQLLREKGFKLSIDDYGTANSTLDYLRKIPASELKIDRKFVQNMLENEADYHLVASTIQLAHRLRMLVVAEGVEDNSTLNTLKSLNCDIIQGYALSKPLEPNAFEVFMSQHLANENVVNLN